MYPTYDSRAIPTIEEIEKQAVKQYKSNLVKWLKSQQREWQNDECSCDWGFQHTIEHIEGEK